MLTLAEGWELYQRAWLLASGYDVDGWDAHRVNIVFAILPPPAVTPVQFWRAAGVAVDRADDLVTTHNAIGVLRGMAERCDWLTVGETTTPNDEDA